MRILEYGSIECEQDNLGLPFVPAPTISNKFENATDLARRRAPHWFAAFPHLDRMAVPASVSALSPEQVALIPSRTLPIGAQLSYLINEFTTLSLSLFAALSSPTPQPTAATYASLALVDEKLAALLPLVAEQQRRERRIQLLVDVLRSKEHAWQAGAAALHSAITTLDPVIESGKLDRAAIAASDPASVGGGALTPATILAYGRLLAPFTSAPPSSLYPPEQRLGAGSIDPSGRGLPVGAIPPFPTEGAMRRGRLQFGRTDEGGMGETTEVGGTFVSPVWAYRSECGRTADSRATSQYGRRRRRWSGASRTQGSSYSSSRSTARLRRTTSSSSWISTCE